MPDSNIISAVQCHIDDAKLVAWDGCHKIYLALDDEQAAWFRAEYEFTLYGDSDAMLDAVLEWWAESCDLRFITAVGGEHADPDDEYVAVVPQGYDWLDDEDDEL